MADPIDFYFDFRSPYAYLAMTQLPGLAEKGGRRIRYKPVDVLALMAKVGNRPTSIECPAKRKYVGADIRRWMKLYEVGMSPAPAAASCDAGLLLSGVIAADSLGLAERYARTVFDAIWLKGLGLSTAEQLMSELEAADLDIIGTAGSPGAWDGSLETIQDEAVAAGVFGVPSFVVAGELFFGNDRLTHLEQAISR